MFSIGNVKPSYHDLVRRDCFSLIPKGAGKLLDLGGGIGATANELKRLGYAGSAGVIDIVAANDQLPTLDFRYSGNIEDLDLIGGILRKEGPFDTILCLDLLEHLREPWDIVRLLHGSLAKGGCIVASIPNIRNYKALLPLLLRDQWVLTDSGILDRTHLRFFVRDTAIELMTCSGLRLQEIKPLPSGGRRIKLFRAATLGLLNSFTDMQYLIRVG